MSGKYVEHEPPRGGHIMFTPGKGAFDPATGDQAPGGDIIFQKDDGTEWLRLTSAGEAFVKGELVASNQAVYAAFRSWITRILSGEWGSYTSEVEGNHERTQGAV